MRRVLYSHRIGAHRLGGNGTIPRGRAHYSHELVGRRVVAALGHLGIETRELIRPEIYSSPTASEFIPDFRKGDIHLIFKPIEEIRILRGAYNIACILWEFDRLNDRALTDNPCSNHARMIKTVDEVWCYCRFTCDVVQQYFANVRLVPVPFNAPGRAQGRAPSLASDLRSVPAIRLADKAFGNLVGFLDRISGPRFIVLTMFNPWDWRKNAGNMLRAFALFQRDKPGAILVIKLIVDNNLDRLENSPTLLGQHCPPHQVGPNVLVITSDLTEEALAELYQLAEFYLCASHCEGLGMPLLEAMGYGTIPITVNNTAMADYINDQNAFVMSSQPEAAWQDSNTSLNPNLTWYTASVTSVALALEQAFHSSTETRNNKRHSAVETVREYYSLEKTTRWLDARMRALGV